MRKIFTLTGSRADYGLMRPVLNSINLDSNFELSILITGMHLLPSFSLSLREVESDSFGTLYKDELSTEDSSGVGMALYLGKTIKTICDLVEEIKPDLVLLQGDRGEMLAAAIASAHMNVPVIHMSGGDSTGSIDDSIRNAITAFANLHLTTCETSTKQLLNSGISAKRIFNVGEPGIDSIRLMDFEDSNDLAQEFKLDLNKPIVIATLHPVTTEAEFSGQQMENMLLALEQFKFQTIITYPNSDAGSESMVDALNKFSKREWLRIVPTLGSRRYLSLLKIATLMVGNSSSGIIESPSFKIPVINIGARQHKRLRANNVIDVGNNYKKIVDGIEKGLTNKDFINGLKDCINPYGDGNTATRTCKILGTLTLADLALITNEEPLENFVPEGWNEI